MCMSSPAPIFRVAKTPRPAESVSETRIGGGPPGAAESASRSPAEEEKGEREENGLA